MIHIYSKQYICSYMYNVITYTLYIYIMCPCICIMNICILSNSLCARYLCQALHKHCFANLVLAQNNNIRVTLFIMLL